MYISLIISAILSIPKQYKTQLQFWPWCFFSYSIWSVLFSFQTNISRFSLSAWKISLMHFFHLWSILSFSVMSIPYFDLVYHVFEFINGSFGARTLNCITKSDIYYPTIYERQKKFFFSFLQHFLRNESDTLFFTITL